MIRYYNGTVFNAATEAIVNTVNCDGVMGAGIALEFGLRYPDMYDEYIRKCQSGAIYVGNVDYYKDSSNITIINFPTKIHFKFPSRIEWVENGLKDFVCSYKVYGFKSVAFPKLGTAKGGLNWDQVRPLMEKYLEPLELDVVICLDELSEAEGIEKSMLEMFNSTSVDLLTKVTRLNIKQKDVIAKGQPFKRFWHIGNAEGIGKKTYASLFTHFYKCALINDSSEQLRIDFKELGLIDTDEYKR